MCKMRFGSKNGFFVEKRVSPGFRFNRYRSTGILLGKKV